MGRWAPRRWRPETPPPTTTGMRPRNPASARWSAGESRNRHAGYTLRGGTSTAGFWSRYYPFKCSGSHPRVQRNNPMRWQTPSRRPISAYLILISSLRLPYALTPTLSAGSMQGRGERRIDPGQLGTNAFSGELSTVQEATAMFCDFTKNICRVSKNTIAVSLLVSFTPWVVLAQQKTDESSAELSQRVTELSALVQKLLARVDELEGT